MEPTQVQAMSGAAPTVETTEPEGAVAVAAPPKARKRKVARQLKRESRLTRWAFGTLSIVIGMAIWQIIAMSEVVDRLFLPEFTTVMSQLWDRLSSGELNDDFTASALPFFLGLFIAMAIGVPLGLLIGVSRIADLLLYPWVIALNSLPRVTFIPMIIIIAGIGQTNHTIVVASTAILPPIVNVAAGVKNIDRDLLEMAESVHSPRLLLFRRILLPGSVPFIFAGFRLAVAMGLIGVVVAELFASSSGIGYELFSAGDTFETVQVYGMMVILAVVGVALSGAARWLEQKFESWRTT